MRGHQEGNKLFAKYIFSPDHTIKHKIISAQIVEKPLSIMDFFLLEHLYHHCLKSAFADVNREYAEQQCLFFLHSRKC